MAKRKLPDWFVLLLGRQPEVEGAAFPQDLDLLKYFTNVDHIVKHFEGQLNGQGEQRPLLVIHGLGGMGKSSLLAKLRSIVLERGLALAYFDPQVPPTPLQVFAGFQRTMKRSEAKTRFLDKAIKKYGAVQQKVQSKLPNAVIQAGGTIAGTLAGHPGAGAALGRVGAETVDALRGFLTQSDFDLYVDPTRQLGDALLADLERLRETPQRCVIMLDHYERFAGTDQWVGEFTSRVHEHALIVIAGRGTPAWSRSWPGWMSHAYVEELHPMRAPTVRTLVHRYYAAIHGGEPPAAEVEAIVAFGRGVPMVVTIAVDLWVHHHYDRFEIVKPQAIVDVVERVMEGVPPATRRWLEAAAAVRWFHRQLLREIVKDELDEQTYVCILRFPFIRANERNVMIHDVIRDIVDENVRTQDPARHIQLHQTAAEIFKAAWRASPDDEHLPELLEWLFHATQSGGPQAKDMLREVCEGFIAAGRVRQLQAVVADLSAVATLDNETRQWLRHYTARAFQLEGKLPEAEALFEETASSATRSGLLQRYSSCGLASIRSRWDRIGTVDGRERALETVDAAIHGEWLDTYTANALFFAGRVKAAEGDWPAVTAFVDRARAFFEKAGDPWGTIRAFNELQGAAVLQGDWETLYRAQRAAAVLLSPPTTNPYLKARTLGYWAWGMVFAGNCHQAELQTRESVTVAAGLEDAASEVVYSRNLGLALAMQGRHAEGIEALEHALKLLGGLGNGFEEARATVVAIHGFALTHAGRWAEAAHCLDQALETKERVGDALGMSESLVWRGHLAMAIGSYDEARAAYRRSLDWKWTGRRHCYSEALVGIARALYATGVHTEATAALEEAEANAAGYREHLAWIYLLKGHLRLDEADASEKSDAIPSAYFTALVHGLHHNRFELDRVAAEIQRACSGTEDGRIIIDRVAMLWENNNSHPLVHSSHASSEASLLLVKLEQQARDMEPGDGSRQVKVIDRLRS